MDKLKRYYAKDGDIDGSFAVLTGGEYNHMVNVMREGEGSRVLLCTGDGTDLVCEIRRIQKGSVTLEILERFRNPREPKVSVTSFCAALKGDRLELAAQKLSELGAAEIAPFLSAHTVAKSVNSERLNKISVESAKQCERSGVMSVSPLCSFGQVLTRLKDFDLALFCNEREEDYTIKQALEGSGEAKKIAVITGCEGGFSEAEAAALSAVGAVSVTLGRRILRAETAAIHAAGIVLYELDLPRGREEEGL